MNMIIFYKIAQVLETPSADDSVPGDLPDAPAGINFTQVQKKLPVENILRNALSFSKNVPVIERQPAEGLY